MLFFIYDFILLIFIIISGPFLLIKLFKKNEISFLKYRLGILSRDKVESAKKPIWFHAASVGEINGIYPIVDCLFQKNNDLEFIVTTYTLTGLKRAKEIFSGIPVVKYFSILPLDISFIISKFIKKINPGILVISETEIWPNLIYHAKKQGVKVLMVNGRISDSAWPKYLSFRFFFKYIVSKIDFYCAQTEIDKNRIISLGMPSKKVEIKGNAKYSFMPITEKEISFILTNPLIVAGSTRPGEEEIILEAFKKIQGKFAKAMLVIAPRHLERVPEVEKIVQRAGVSYVLRSKYLKDSDSRFTVLILDTMGELSAFYKLSDLSFVGGTLKPFDGHNILEPAAFNKPVLFGPYVNNVKEASEDLLKSGGGRKIYNSKDLEQAFNEILLDENKNKTMGERAHFVFKKHKQSAMEQAGIIELWEKY
ncbi:MAG: 3-deoxy-D-manno-octulosonic acid transferase [bacterium]